MEGAELLHRESNSVERLMQYLDENLIMLNNQLNEDNFQGILNVIWNAVALLLNQLVKNSLEVRILYKIKKKKFYHTCTEVLSPSPSLLRSLYEMKIFINFRKEDPRVFFQIFI